MSAFLNSLLAFVFAIGLLVAIHEWGHYIVARMAGIKVLRFSVGFGRPLWMTTRGPDQTEYCLAAIPLGGYVKLLDEREGDVAAHELHRTFNRQSVAARVAVLVAGPLMNFVFAILAYWLMFVAGVPGMQPVVGEVQETGIAAAAGIQTGDRILTVANEEVQTWEGAVLLMLDELLAADVIAMQVEKTDGRRMAVDIPVGGKVAQLTEPGGLFAGLGITPWSPTLEPVLGELTPGEAAQVAGLQTGDRIVMADDVPMEQWMDWVEFIRERPGVTVDVLVVRDGTEVRLPLTIGSVVDESGASIGRIGAGPDVPEGFFDQYRAEQKYGVLKAFSVALDRTWSMADLTVRMVGRMLVGDVSVKNISGPINIAQYAGYSASIGFASFLSFLGIVSLSLGILNLLPIPVLDGGQIIYQLAEAVKGSPLSERAQMVGQQIGLFFLVILMGVAFYNDLTRFFS